ncbi:hypothetical protein HZS_5394 [Henneguya salminicola]|nr:hypothetical protein HZS_5394 [Henneguya salminicola]
MDGRANNELERYTRRFGELYINEHQNISAFVMAIKVEFEFYSESCKQVRENVPMIFSVEISSALFGFFYSADFNSPNFFPLGTMYHYGTSGQI